MLQACKVCHIVKPEEEFYLSWSKPSKKTPVPQPYREHTCKACESLRNKAYRQEHAARLDAKRRARWRAAHPLPPPRPEDILTKVCQQCSEEKPLYKFGTGTKNNRPGYRDPRCSACVTQGPPPPKPPKTTKRCTRCKETKPRDAFVPQPTPTNPANRMSRCRACLSLLNKSKLLHLKATDPAGYDAFRSQRNTESRTYYAQRIKDDPTYRYRSADSAARRRDTKRGYRHISRVARAAIILRDRSICGICGLKVSPADMSIDHIIPAKHGGIYEAINLQVAHLRCNQSRGAGRLPAQLRLF